MQGKRKVLSIFVYFATCIYVLYLFLIHQRTFQLSHYVRVQIVINLKRNAQVQLVLSLSAFSYLPFAIPSGRSVLRYTKDPCNKNISNVDK